VGNVPLVVFARDFGEHVPLIMEEGDASDIARRLRQGEAVLGTALADRLGVGICDEIEMPTPQGLRSVRGCGLGKEYSVAGMVLYMAWDRASALFGFTQPHVLVVRAEPDWVAVLGSTLAEYTREHEMVLQRKEDFEAVIHRVVVGVRWLVAGLVGVI